MPTTVGTLVAFLFLLTPGLVFELLRERSRPAREHSAFRDASIAVVASVAFSSLALALLLVVRAVDGDWMPSPEDLVRHPGRYTADHLGLVARALLLEVGLATGLAWLWHRVLCWRHPGGRITLNPAWFEIVRGTANPRHDRVYVSLDLQDGSTVRGLVKGYDMTADRSLGNLVLTGGGDHPLTRRAPGEGEGASDRRLDGEGWAYVVVPATQITTATVGFLPRPGADAAGR
jgi:hypothetical protein